MPPRKSPQSRKVRKARPAKKHVPPEPPPATDWCTTDHYEILKRRLRAREESFHIENLDSAEPVFLNFAIPSPTIPAGHDMLHRSFKLNSNLSRYPTRDQSKHRCQ